MQTKQSGVRELFLQKSTASPWMAGINCHDRSEKSKWPTICYINDSTYPKSVKRTYKAFFVIKKLIQLLLPWLARAILIHSFSRVNSLFHHLLYSGRRRLCVSSRIKEELWLISFFPFILINNMLFEPSFCWRLLVVLRRLPHKISRQKRAMYECISHWLTWIGRELGESVVSGEVYI